MAVKYYTKLLLFTCCLVLSQALPRYSYSRPLNGAGSASSFAYAPRPQQPMTLTGNYNLIMPDYYDHHPAASMQLQNFANFYDAQMSPGNDLGMDESRFLESSTPVRGPQPLTAHERKVRQKLPVLDVAQEKKSSLKLKKGNTKPRGADYQQWDQFDYDLYSVYPGESKKYKNDA